MRQVHEACLESRAGGLVTVIKVEQTSRTSAPTMASLAGKFRPAGPMSRSRTTGVRDRRERAAATAREYLPALLLFLALLGICELLVAVLRTESWLLPAPSRIWEAFLGTRPLLPAHIRTTPLEALAGLALAASLGVVIATVPLVRRVLYPLLVVSQTIPMIVPAPLLVIWLGFGMAPKIVVVALVGFFPIVVSTVNGLEGADPEMVALVRSMGASRMEELRRVLFPAAVPASFAGLRSPPPTPSSAP